jgi:hypothetical protein
VIRKQTQVAEAASNATQKSFDKYAEHYALASDGDLIRISEEFDKLTPVAQKAIIIEIAKRGLKGSSPILEDGTGGKRSEKSYQIGAAADWDYERMSDEELQQLNAAYSTLHQPVPDALNKEVDLRASSRTKTIPSPVITSPAALPIQVATAKPQAAISTASQPTFTPPYARFVILLLSACGSASAGVFAFFDAFSRDSTALALEVLSIGFTLVFGLLGWKTWKLVKEREPRSEPNSRRRVRKTLVTSVIFVVLYLALAALLGSAIGQNRAEAIQLNSDLATQKELASRITKARTSVSGSIPAYVAMYRGIESDVQEYASTLSKLKQDWGKYQARFPAQHENVQKQLAFVEKELKRSGLLARQIIIAKQVEQLDSDQQRLLWRRDMLPVLEQEDALDKTN